MGKWYCGMLAAMGGLALAGCAEQRAGISPTDAIAQVQTGRTLLSCREPCLAEWRRVQPEAVQLNAAQRWPELAALVLQVGYEDDLSLYYLGRAAEGVGFPGAAASYYRQSTRISATSASCRALSQVCGGVVLPKATWLRLAAIERALAPPARRGARRGIAAPEIGEPPEMGETPAEAAVPVPERVPVPPPAPFRPGPAASEFIEPPPAPR